MVPLKGRYAALGCQVKTGYEIAMQQRNAAGGVGTIHGPVLGAFFYVILREVLAVQWVELHLLIFGALFILVVVFLPGGLVEAWGRVRGSIARPE